MLDVSHVTEKYGKILSCDDVSFHLDTGSVTVLPPLVLVITILSAGVNGSYYKIRDRSVRMNTRETLHT